MSPSSAIRLFLSAFLDMARFMVFLVLFFGLLIGPPVIGSLFGTVPGLIGMILGIVIAGPLSKQRGLGRSPVSPSSLLQKRCSDGGWHRWVGRECVKCYLTKGRESRRNANDRARRDALLELRGVVEGLPSRLNGALVVGFDPFAGPGLIDRAATLAAIDHLLGES